MFYVFQLQKGGGGQAPERPPYTDPPLASRPINVSVVSVVPVFTRFQNVSELEVCMNEPKEGALKTSSTSLRPLTSLPQILLSVGTRQASI